MSVLFSSCLSFFIGQLRGYSEKKNTKPIKLSEQFGTDKRQMSLTYHRHLLV